MTTHSFPISWLTFGIWLGLTTSLFSISPDNSPSKDNRPETEQAAFSVHEDFEIELFADESLGIANPIAIHWDPEGRLWVLCTLAYAQLKPGEVPDDQLFILEDTDRDGRADKSTVFARGLDMPTGFALGNGGVYLAEGTDLVFLKDLDGDDQADHREVLLSGFGTGDTHQNISNLVCDAGGFLYFTQGLHTFSQVETPWGVSRGDTAGFWRFDPRRTKLDPFGFPSMTSQNPCGAALDRWGALFIKSNGPHLCFATPGLVPTTHHRELMQFAQVGQTPGKSMGVDIVESAHLPDWIQGHAIIAGYFAREVSAIPLVPDGAGFAKSAPIRLVYGGHESFRPVDIRQGPDGAIYLADWFNPIINHYQVSLRHPDRDYTHGRIWRLVAKNRAAVSKPDWKSLTPEARFQRLGSQEKWTREQARRLQEMESDDALASSAIESLLLATDAQDPTQALLLVEGSGILESRNAISPGLLDHLQSAASPFVRATVARILGRSEVVDPHAQERLARLLRDPHPRPRLEAVIACANQPHPQSLPLALSALDPEAPDRFIEYSLSQAIFALESSWLDSDFGSLSESLSPSQLAFVFDTHGGPASVDLARKVLEKPEIQDPERALLLDILVRLGNESDLRAGFDFALEHEHAALLEALADAPRQPKPPVAPASLETLLSHPQPEVRAAALRLVGRWRIASLTPTVEAIARDPQAAPSDRIAALGSLAALRGSDASETLASIASANDSPESVRSAAIGALARLDLKEASAVVAGQLALPTADARLSGLVTPLLDRGGGLSSLANSLQTGEEPLSESTASALLTFLNLKGRTDEKLTPLLNEILGLSTGAPDYDADRVAALMKLAQSDEASAERGQAIYERPALGCVACHRIGDTGGVIGPKLTTVGAGLPLDQIIESILWPGRQVKEGYQALSITRRDGRVITGYLEREGDDILWYRNTTAPWILPLDRKEIASRQSIPTLMPSGLTQSLSDEELGDLVAYLASLKGKAH